MENIKNKQMRKLEEYNYGSNVFMKLELNSKVYSVNLYFRVNKNGDPIEIFETSADGTDMREEVIAAFCELY